MEYILAPSILAADFRNLGQEMKKTEENGAQYLHFDVMDGMFVPSISFGMPVLASIHDVTDQVMDAHLMVQDPIRYIEAFQKAGADMITVHLEACEDVYAALGKIRESGLKAGLSICPETEADAVRPYLKDVDMILVMCVHPVDIQVDGGIYLSNVREVLDAGANVIVAGSAVFNGDPGENTKNFMEILRTYE